jgi:LmbE family N-acetylglucosaminyl deacetylase
MHPASRIPHPDMFTRTTRSCGIVLSAALLSLTSTSAQLRVAPVAEHPDAAALELLLRKLSSTATFMQTDAHPDDEDNALLAMLGEGEGMRTTLVTATRGDGGQNEIGPELSQALGVLRTEELLAVHRFDGAEQYFTRAVDFGYSFSVEESIQKWGHDEIVGDYVRHIRALRPDVIVGFLCGGEGGGQHHQASARLTLEAFSAAADPNKYAEQIQAGLHPWQALRVFCTDTSAFMPNPPPPTPDQLRVDVAGFDPAFGRTYAELGLEARSMHKCQGTSQLLLLPGQAQNRTYKLQDSKLDARGVAPKNLFDGIDTSLVGLVRFTGSRPPELIAPLQAIADDVAAARKALATGRLSDAVSPLAAGLRALRALRGNPPAVLTPDARYEIDLRLAQKERQFEDALVIASAIRLDALADDGVVVPGQPVSVSVYAAVNSTEEPRLESVTLAGFAGAASSVCAGPLVAAKPLSCKAGLSVPPRTHLSTPYWTPRNDAARYDFDADVPFGVPFRPSPFRATFQLTIRGERVDIERDVQFRYSNVMAGEKRSQLEVAPPFNVRVDPDIAVFPVEQSDLPTNRLRQGYGESAGASAKAEGGSHGNPDHGNPDHAASGFSRKNIRVTVGNNEKGAADATVTLSAPAGWQVEPSSAAIHFVREDEESTVTFTVRPADGARPGDFELKAVAAAAGVQSDLGYEVVEYPHIHRRHVVQTATTRAKVMDVKITPGLHVGYIMGVGDRVPDAIEQLGADVRLIDSDTLAAGDLSQFNVIVVGVRAYERRPDLRANNQRLLQYAETGGTVIVQYQRNEFNEAQYGPYPAKTTSDRVTDENAPIDVLVPNDPVFTTPNRIGAESWQGWVQERGTYFLGQKDPRYVDLVRSRDPFPLNAGPKTGALVEARTGKGRWIYVGLGLWRQLPAGVDGAYRLMANLLSSGH